jgi:hypothetical protein
MHKTVVLRDIGERVGCGVGRWETVKGEERVGGERVEDWVTRGVWRYYDRLEVLLKMVGRQGRGDRVMDDKR